MSELKTQADTLRQLFVEGLAAKPTPRKVLIPKLLGELPVYVSHLTTVRSAEIDRLREQSRELLEGFPEHTEYAVLVAFVSMCDADGSRLFTKAEDLKFVCALPVRVISQIVELVNELGDEFVDETRKNS